MNDFILQTNDQQLRRDLGIGQLDLQRWVSGEQISNQSMANAIQLLATQYNYDISLAQIQTELAAIRAQGGDALDTITNIGLLVVKGYAALHTGGASTVVPS